METKDSALRKAWNYIKENVFNNFEWFPADTQEGDETNKTGGGKPSNNKAEPEGAGNWRDPYIYQGVEGDSTTSEKQQTAYPVMVTQENKPSFNEKGFGNVNIRDQIIEYGNDSTIVIRRDTEKRERLK